MLKVYRAWVAVTVLVLISACLFFALHFWEPALSYEPFLTKMLLLSVAALIPCIAVDIHYATKLVVEPPLADRYHLQQTGYPELLDHYSNQLLADGYAVLGDIPNTLGCAMRLYFRWGFWDMECFLFLYVREYSPEMESEYGTLFWDFLCAQWPEAAQRDVSLISLVCVDDLSPAFESRVNANIQQSPGRFHLPAGACLSDRTVYVPCQVAGRYRAKYKAMRSQLMRYI